MSQTYKIERIENLIEIGTTLGKNWYRGHSRIINELTPCIHRPKYTNQIYNQLNPNAEFRIAEDFKRIAPSLVNDIPAYENNLEWLFLMQHHGAPTRLLDWSENILVATFFAVTSDYKNDGELWSFLPWKLNENHGFSGLPTLKNRTLLYLANEIFHNNPKQLAEENEMKEIPKIPMALMPPMKHPRISAQQSCFTIHPNPETGNTIPEVLKDEKYLIRYIIPKEFKNEIERKLIYLGISYRTLFPDLEGLAKSLIQKEKYLGWGQPDPPKYKDYD